MPGVVATIGMLPIAVVEPSQWGDFLAGYITPTVEAGTIEAFFAGNYDPAMANFDFTIRGPITVGECATVGFFSISPLHNKPLLLIAGQQDLLNMSYFVLKIPVCS